jgi:predicted nucleotidyltransferase
MEHGAPLADADVPVSHSPAVAGAVREYLRSSCRVVLETLGSGDVAAVVVSGSATRGEVTAVRSAETGLLVLSDIDLAVVMKSDVLRDRAKGMRAAIMEKIAGSPATASICPPPELGVYSLNDLEIQPWKMGVYEIRASGKVLWGDDRVLERIPGFGPEQIPSWEAIVLLFNRCLEMLEALDGCVPDDPRAVFRLLYASAKAYLDVGTSIAVSHGCYVAGYRARLEEIRLVLAERYPDGLAGFPPQKLMEGFAFWTDFKIEPDLVGIRKRYGLPGDTGRLEAAASIAFAEARVALLSAWMALASVEAAAAPGGTLEACRLFLAREGLAARLRGWKQASSDRARASLFRALRLCMAGSPLHLLRLCSMCVLDQCVAKADSGSAHVNALRYRPPADEDQAAAFLKRYFPAKPEGAAFPQAVEDWRRLVVGTWRHWTERFWS